MAYDHPNAELELEFSKLKSASKKMKHERRRMHNTFEQLICAVSLGASTAVLEELLEGYKALEELLEGSYKGHGLSGAYSYHDEKMDEVVERDPLALYAIENANQYGNLRVLEVLIKHGLCVVPGEFNSLVYAARVWRDEDYAVATVKLLLQRDPYAVHSSWSAVTPLMEAARRGSVKLVQLFLDAGACTSQHVQRKNALYHAHYHGHAECARLIEAAVEREHCAGPAAALERAKAGLEGAKAKVALSIAATKEFAHSAAAKNPPLKRKREEAAAAGGAVAAE